MEKQYGLQRSLLVIGGYRRALTYKTYICSKKEVGIGSTCSIKNQPSMSRSSGYE